MKWSQSWLISKHRKPYQFVSPMRIRLMSGYGMTAVGAKRTTNGKSPSDCEKDDRAATGAVALRGHSERQLLAPRRSPDADTPCCVGSITMLARTWSAAI